MPRRTKATVFRRRAAIIELAATDPIAVEDICRTLRPRAARRTIHEDLLWLTEHFPDQFRKVRAGGSRVTYRWFGQPPYVLGEPLSWLTENELVALVVAKGILREVDPFSPAVTDEIQKHDPLAGAINELVGRAGVHQSADFLSKSVVSVSRFGVAPVEPDCFATCLAAIVTGQSCQTQYRNLAGTTKAMHFAPQRLVLIRGEWYCFAWAGRLRTLRLSRMGSTVRCPELPPGMPTIVPDRDIDALLRGAFYATSGERPKDRARVELLIFPEAWPMVEGRRWGERQEITDLDDGSHVISFTTTGMLECLHWILSLGRHARPIAPPELLAIYREHVSAMFTSLVAGCAEHTAHPAPTVMSLAPAKPLADAATSPPR